MDVLTLYSKGHETTDKKMIKHHSINPNRSLGNKTSSSKVCSGKKKMTVHFENS